MSRWLVLSFLLCPACVSGSAPSPPAPEGDEGVAKVADPPGDPALGVDRDPPGDEDPAEQGEVPEDPSGEGESHCEALWEIAERVGCLVAKLVCAAADDFPIGDVLIPCEVAVPIACGLVSATTDALAELCPDD